MPAIVKGKMQFTIQFVLLKLYKGSYRKTGTSIYNTICAIKTCRNYFTEHRIRNIYNTICAIKTGNNEIFN